MKKILKIVITLLVLAGIGAGVYWMYDIARCRKLAAMAGAESKLLKVAVVRVQKATLEKKIAVTGEIEALQIVDVVPKVTGVLERLRLPDGTAVEDGVIIQWDSDTKDAPVIAVIEHAALKAALQQTQAALEVARANHKRAVILLGECRREKERIERVFKKGVATEGELDKAVTACSSRQSEVKLVMAQVAQAQAAVRQAQVRLNEATIQAPILGVVVKKYVDEGNMVGPTTPLVRIARIDVVEVIGGVSERYFRSLSPGRTEATITVDAFPGEIFQGNVHLVGQAVDSATRTIKIEIRIPNPDRKLKPGMFARVSLVLDRKTNVPVIPDTAILRDEQGPYVYVINGSKANRRKVTLGLSRGILHEVLSGLKPGDCVVVMGQRQLFDGQCVETVQENKP